MNRNRRNAELTHRFIEVSFISPHGRMLLAGVLMAALQSPAGSQERDNRRMVPAHCQPKRAAGLSGQATGLTPPAAFRRLRGMVLLDLPGMGAEPAKALEEPPGSNDLSKLLGCLAGE